MVSGVPERLSETEDIAAEPHCEWGGFLLVTAEDEAQGCEQGLADLVGGSGRSLVTGLESSEVEFRVVLAIFVLQASWAFAAHAFLCSFSANLPIIEDRE